jgi:hypothetical protein
MSAPLEFQITAGIRTSIGADGWTVAEKTGQASLSLTGPLADIKALFLELAERDLIAWDTPR